MDQQNDRTTVFLRAPGGARVTLRLALAAALLVTAARRGDAAPSHDGPLEVETVETAIGRAVADLPAVPAIAEVRRWMARPDALVQSDKIARTGRALIGGEPSRLLGSLAADPGIKLWIFGKDAAGRTAQYLMRLEQPAKGWEQLLELHDAVYQPSPSGGPGGWGEQRMQVKTAGAVIEVDRKETTTDIVRVRAGKIAIHLSRTQYHFDAGLAGARMNGTDAVKLHVGRLTLPVVTPVKGFVRRYIERRVERARARAAAH